MHQPMRKKLDSRLNRIAGQVAGLQRMVQEDRYCVDILTQIAAVRSALDALGTELLTAHIASCVAGEPQDQHACARQMSREQLLNEVQVTLKRFLQ